MSNGQVSMDTRLDLKTLEEKLKGKTLGLWMLSVTGTKQALIRCIGHRKCSTGFVSASYGKATTHLNLIHEKRKKNSLILLSQIM